MRTKALSQICIACLSAVAFVSSSSAAERADGPKVLATGWDIGDATPSEYLAHADLFEKLPINGVTFNLKGTNAAGQRLWYRTIMTDPPWDEAAFAADVPVLRKLVEMRPFRASLMNAFRLTGERIAWTDDAAWARFASNMGVLAAVTRKAGVAGILVDPEDYPKNGQFRLRREDGEPVAVANLVRRRAREVFGAVFRAHPSATVLSYAFLSWCNKKYLSASDPRAAVLAAGDLFPAFVDGILDVLPPEATLVDGAEQYRNDALRNDFAVSYVGMKKAVALVSPENRSKYLLQMKVGFGMFVDMYWREKAKDFNWYIGPVNGSRLEHFRLNFAQAMDVADGVVWLYMPRSSVVKWRNIASRRYLKRNSIEENLPGFADAIASVRDQDGFAAARLARLGGEGSLVDLLRDAKAGTWQRSFKDRAAGDMDADALVATGVKEGSFTIEFRDAAPGELYALRASMEGVGGTAAYRFRSSDPDADFEWVGRKPVTMGGDTFIRVPQGVKGMQLLLRVSQRPGETVRFAKPKLYRLQ